MTLKTEREKYTGREASEYESRRKNAPPWQQEQDAVSLLVKNGPVLDVPIGTGRYLPIYQAKGLAYVGCDISADMIEQALRRDPALAFKEGDILNLPFADKAFATAVCTRLLNWLAPDEMQKAVRELHRVAHTVVLSIRVGEGAQRQKTYTHKAGDLLDALDGAWITDELLLRDEGPAATTTWCAASGPSGGTYRPSLLTSRQACRCLRMSGPSATAWHSETSPTGQCAVSTGLGKRSAGKWTRWRYWSLA